MISRLTGKLAGDAYFARPSPGAEPLQQRCTLVPSLKKMPGVFGMMGRRSSFVLPENLVDLLANFDIQKLLCTIVRYLVRFIFVAKLYSLNY